MAYIKKLVMYGFKSFPRKTEIPFTPGINVILGPNGSGKSNVSDALCFVLGRLSIKSMRATKASNLIFQGTKVAAPSREASVEIVFDNSDNVFAIDSSEIVIKRIVRKNGQSLYKINDATKTRQEILSLLAQAGIDPNGFNIILQGEIQNLVRMHTEERRKIIEEVSGISVYETRKEKSIKELERTEEKLKEVLAILRERTLYLNNLEKERQQALKFKKLQEEVKSFKASIIYQELQARKKQNQRVDEEIEKRNKEIEKIKSSIFNLETNVKIFEEKIASINSTIQKQTGLEQEKLNQEIANLRAELAGLNVKFENSEGKINSVARQKLELQELIRNNELTIKELQKESPSLGKKQKEIESKKNELEKIEEQRKKFYMIKSELKSLRERLQDKQNIFHSYKSESDFLIKQIDSLSLELFDKKSDPQKLSELKRTLTEKKQALEEINSKEISIEKTININEHEIGTQKSLFEKVSKMDICPVCKSKITEQHIHGIKTETNQKMNFLDDEIRKFEKELNQIYEKRNLLKQDIEQISLEIVKRESDIHKIATIESKKEQIKFLHEKIQKTEQEIFELKKRQDVLERNFEENANIEQKYETARVEMQEISIRTNETVNSEIIFKQSELERAKISLRQLVREEQDFSDDATTIKSIIKEKETLLERRKKQEEELSKNFQKLISERDGFQSKIRESEQMLIMKRNMVYKIEQEINNFKIEKARYDAEVENFETEMLEFPDAEIIKTNKESLQERLAKTQEILSRIGSVNLRSLEMYDDIKKEYDTVNEKVQIIAKEKEGILKIIHEIDIKKKKTFMQTFVNLNEIFSRNFAQISTKGQVSLELENKKEPFEGGVGILVKTGHGKYFDVTSLSGGEQTMVALSLIFAIQELNPYCFYILDEIDAALDKRNSARLAALLKKYMQKGQYLVITHNDEIITNATNLYGISMHEGVSKIISLRI